MTYLSKASVLAIWLGACFATSAHCQTMVGQQNMALPPSCNSSATPPIAEPRANTEPRAITFRSHLGLEGDVNADPLVSLGETILLVPDPAEPMRSKEAILVRLPDVTPYPTARDSLYYLRGYAIGQLSAANKPFR